MPNRTAIVALAAAALMMIGTPSSASTREVVRYTAEVQPGTIVVKTAERRLYLVLGGGEAIRYSQIWPWLIVGSMQRGFSAFGG
jgi:lipoprotein-anchoring transpeptidase ErfK/SrfK